MLRSIFAAARGWFLRAPDCKHQEKFGLAKLEGSLVLLLFLVQIGLTFLGVQENFWMALFCWLAIVVLALHILWKWEVAAGLRNLGRVGLSVALVVVVCTFSIQLCPPNTSATAVFYVWLVAASKWTQETFKLEMLCSSSSRTLVLPLLHLDLSPR